MSKKKTYSEKLKDPRWQKRRLEIMGRASFACETCGDGSETLNVHHKYYERGKDPWEYPDAALMCICEDCHEQNAEIERRLLRAIRPCEYCNMHKLISAMEIATECGGGLLRIFEAAMNKASSVRETNNKIIEAYKRGVAFGESKHVKDSPQNEVIEITQASPKKEIDVDLWVNLLPAIKRASAFTYSYFCNFTGCKLSGDTLNIFFPPSAEDVFQLVGSCRRTDGLVKAKMKELGFEVNQLIYKVYA